MSWEKTMRSFIAAGVAVAALVVAGASRAADKEIEWAKSYDSALKSAKESGKLVMVDFTADWCGWCKELDKKTYSDAKVIEFAKDKLVSVKVDTETPEGAKLQQKFEVSGLPTILFLDGEGKVQGKVVGFKPAAPFLAKLDIVNKAFKEMPAMIAKLKANPGDKVVGDVAQIYVERGELKEAEKVLAAAVKAGADPKELAKVHNAIGDGHQEAERFPDAIKEFHKAAEAGAPKDKVYALSSIAACYMSMGKFKDATAAVEKSLAVQGATDEDKKEALALRSMLKEKAEGAEKEAAAREKAARLIKWAKNFDDALAQAKDSKRYAMVDFTADWCIWCKRLDSDVYADETAAKAIDESVVSVKVDTESDEGKPIADRYKSMIQGLPTILFVDDKGEVVGRMVGYKPATEFVKAVQETIKAAKEFPDVLAAWKKDNKNTDAGLKVAQSYLERGDVKNAQTILKDLEKNGVDIRKLGRVYFEIAQALMQGDKSDEGEAILKRLSTDGNADERAKALVMMGMSKAQKEDFEGAKDLLDKAVKIEGVSQETLQRAEQIRKSLQSIIDRVKKQKEEKKDG
jgi:thioredoxin-related protein